VQQQQQNFEAKAIGMTDDCSMEKTFLTLNNNRADSSICDENDQLRPITLRRKTSAALYTTVKCNKNNAYGDLNISSFHNGKTFFLKSSLLTKPDHVSSSS
jgi:hypothetical protein